MGQLHQEDAEPKQDHCGFAPTDQPAAEGWGQDTGRWPQTPDFGFWKLP